VSGQAVQVSDANPNPNPNPNLSPNPNPNPNSNPNSNPDQVSDGAGGWWAAVVKAARKKSEPLLDDESFHNLRRELATRRAAYLHPTRALGLSLSANPNS